MATASRTTSKKRRDTPRPGPVMVKGAIVILVLGVAAFFATRVYNGLPGKSYNSLFVETTNVGNLLAHDQVRIDGTRVGQVLKRGISDEGFPRIELQLDPGTDIPAGTKANFRANGLLGARFVDLELGDGEPLPTGATIQGTERQYAFGVPEALGTFDEETRGRLGDTLGGLGQGLLGQGMGLNDTIRIANDQALNFRDVARRVLEEDGAAERLVPALNAAVTPLDRNRADLSELNGLTAEAVTPFVTEREATRDTLTVAGPALRAVTPGLGKGTELVREVDHLAVALNGTLPGAPEGLTALRDLLRTGRAPLIEAERLVDALGPAVPGVLKITDGLGPVLEPLRTTLRDATNTLQQVGKYECDIRNFGTTMRSMTGFTQPGSGPGGPSQAFRLQMVLPLSVDAIGLREDSGVYNRRGVIEPCTFLSHDNVYPQFNPNQDGGVG